MPDPQRAWPAQIDPANASVFDSWLTKLGREVAGAIDSGQLASSAMGASPAIAMVPREAVESLVPRLLKAWTERYGQVGQAVPDAVTEVVQTLAQRFPRAMSHIHSIEPLSEVGSSVRGRFRPMPADWNGQAGWIQINPNQTPEQLLQTLTHELTHGGQQLRAVSRGTDIDALYSAFPEQYFTNPFEVRARTAQINQAYRQSPQAFASPAERLKAAQEQAVNPFANEWMKR